MNQIRPNPVNKRNPMLETTRRRFSTTQTLLIGLGVLLVIFLILGTINQAVTPKPAFVFGIEGQPFVIFVFIAFMGGILSFVSPCTLPILPAYFAFAFQSGRKQVAANTLAFILGLASLFSLLGASAGVLGRFLNSSQTILVLVGGAAVMIFGVMSLLGKGFTGLQSLSQQEHDASLTGSFLFGMTFAVGWSGCVGPILGAVYGLAINQSPLRGAMGLFMYAMGLGLPLLIVSTFFGRADRDSLLWRILRGKGATVTTYTAIIAVVWALAIWRILVAFVQYAFNNFSALSGQEFLPIHQWVLLLAALVGVGLWFYTSRQGGRVTLNLHSTQLISGLLFLALGLMMISGTLTRLNALIPLDWSEPFLRAEDWFIQLFN